MRGKDDGDGAYEYKGLCVSPQEVTVFVPFLHGHRHVKSQAQGAMRRSAATSSSSSAAPASGATGTGTGSWSGRAGERLRRGGATSSRIALVAVVVLLLLLLLLLGARRRSLAATQDTTTTTTTTTTTARGDDERPLTASRASVEPLALAGIRELVKRRAPLDDAKWIHVRLADVRVIAPGANAKEAYSYAVSARVDPDADLANAVGLFVEGTSPTAVARGLRDFYANECGVELVSWADPSRPAFPCVDTLIQRETPLQRVVRLVPFSNRYAFNVVTFAYSFKLWKWARWEQELDWLALRGVNVALAHVGQESVFRRAFASAVGSSPVALAAFECSVAYAAWCRMGNVKGLGSRESPEFHQGQMRLAHALSLIHI